MLLVALVLGCQNQSTSQAAPRAPRIHPAFSITEAGLDQVLAGLPDEVAVLARQRPEYFLELLGQVLEGPQDLVVLIDKQYATSTDYAPPDLVNLSNFQVALTRNDLQLRHAAMPDLLAMVEAGRLEGLEVVLSSSYRSYARQEAIFAQNVASIGPEQTELLVAKPGHSQHQLGTTIDFGTIDEGYGRTPQGRWLLRNAWRFGFSLSYPEGMEAITGYQYEPWHYRHIGRPAATMEHEFFLGVQQWFLSFYYSAADTLRAAHDPQRGTPANP